MDKNNWAFKIFFCAFLFFSSAILSKVNASRDDFGFELLYPQDNPTISGNLNIYWTLENSGIKEVPYEIQLWEGECSGENNFVSHIIQDKFSYYSNREVYSYEWDTTESLENASSIDDGKYCLLLRIYPNGETKPGLETFSPVNISNSGNQSPIINNAISDIFITQGESMNHDLYVSDPEQDVLSYKIVKGAAILAVKGDGELIINTDNADVGANLCVVQVSDNKGASTLSVFYVNVLEQLDEVNNDIGQNFLISQPIFVAEKPSDVEWELPPEIGFNEGIISYSADGITWLNLAEFQASDDKITLDFHGIAEGRYFLRALFIRNEKRVLGLTKEIQVVSASDNIVKPSISVYDLIPEPDSKIWSDTSIRAKFVFPTEVVSSQEEFYIYLDDETITSYCEFIENEFECILPDPFAIGVHEVFIKFVQEDIDFVRSFIFEVTSEEEELQDEIIIQGVIDVLGSEISISALVFGLILICFFVIILVIPWLIYLLWTRGKTTKTHFPKVVPDTSSVQPIQGYIPPPTSAPQQGSYATTKPDLKYDIGTQTIEPGTSSAFSPIGDDTSVPEPVLPSTYTDEDLPEWLRMPSSSQPVGAQGFSYTTPEPLQGTEPYGYKEYGKGSNSN
jgi:hypothetical protein